MRHAGTRSRKWCFEKNFSHVPVIPLILASASPRRRELLARAGFSFEVVVSAAEENEDPHGDPAQMVVENALAKARAVAAKRPEALVLGADTTVALDGRVFNKPADLDEAREMLRALGGKTHTVFTGTAFVRGNAGLEETRLVACRVRFKPLDDDTISRYFKIVNPLDKAGAYGIQTGRDIIVESYEEPLSNIVGLPAEIIAPRLRELLAEPAFPRKTF